MHTSMNPAVQLYLHMLTGLDQLPHEVFQLAVPLDQIAEVGIQHLLRKNNSKAATSQKRRFNMPVHISAAQFNSLREKVIIYQTSYIHNSVWRFLLLRLKQGLAHRCTNLSLSTSNGVWLKPAGPSAQTRHGGGNRASVTDLELKKKVDRVYLMSFNPEAACVSP